MMNLQIIHKSKKEHLFPDRLRSQLVRGKTPLKPRYINYRNSSIFRKI